MLKHLTLISLLVSFALAAVINDKLFYSGGIHSAKQNVDSPEESVPINEEVETGYENSREYQGHLTWYSS